MIQLIRGDCLEVMRGMDAGCVHCCVTSPPYYGLRDYGVEGQIGLEPTPDAYVARLVEVFREVRRLLRDDGTLWLNLGDSYASIGRSERKESPGVRAVQAMARVEREVEWLPRHGGDGKFRWQLPGGIKPKDLIGIPWMVAFALRADGWYLRSDCIWHKPNPMPESVRDRPTRAHEYLFLFAKSESYYYDKDAIQEADGGRRAGNVNGFKDRQGTASFQARSGGEGSEDWEPGAGRNKRSVWTVTTRPYKGAHFATFPENLIEPCILAGTSQKGCCPSCGAPWTRIVDRYRTRDGRRCDDLGSWKNTDPGSPIGAQGDGHWRYSSVSETKGWQPSCRCVRRPSIACVAFDPFNGAGTTGVVAKRHSRRYVGIDIKSEYIEMSRARIEGTRVEMPLFAATTS